MDEKRPEISLQAPVLSSGSFPLVDDHLVEPEVTRDEIIAGRLVVGLPNEEAEAVQLVELRAVLRGHVAPGYQASADLLTRFAWDSDFGTDACVYRKGEDPATGGRYLEEIAFFVIAERDEQDVVEKAGLMRRRGVRRIFGIWAKSRRICEWCAESGSWSPLDAAFRIDDPCLVPPMPVAALFDRQLAENAIVEALAAKRVPALQIRLATARAEGRIQGRAEGIAESILGVLEARGVVVSLAQRGKILCCSDLEQLDGWIRRASLATTADEVLTQPS